MRFEVFVLLALIPIGFCESLDNGLGADISWTAWSQATEAAQQSGKPLMVVLHKPWCPACKNLKSWFSTSQQIEELSRNFVMVNVPTDEFDPKELDVDGGYVPRILFLDPEGKVLEDVHNPGGNPDYKYFYYDESSVLQSMKSVAEDFQTHQEL